MLGIARYTDYAARLVLHLACQEGPGAIPIARIAEARLLPAPYVRRLVGRLVAAKILATERGALGGVRLARPASEISLLDVVLAMEGGVFLNQCLERDHSCPLAQGCPVREAWGGITDAVKARMAAVRFDALARGAGDHERAHRKPRAKGDKGTR
jgi:Rrf2 family protein